MALGLGLVTAVFAIYNVFLLRTDAVESPGELFTVAITQRTGPDNEPDVVCAAWSRIVRLLEAGDSVRGFFRRPAIFGFRRSAMKSSTSAVRIFCERSITA